MRKPRWLPCTGPPVTEPESHTCSSELGSVEQVADALVTAARLPTGKLQDDLAMFVVRPR